MAMRERGGPFVRFKFPALDSLAAGRGPHELPPSPVACLFFLPSYRASFLLPLPSSMAMVIFFMVAVLMVVTLVGLLLWFFCLRACLVSNRVRLGGAKAASLTRETASCELFLHSSFLSFGSVSTKESYQTGPPVRQRTP